MSGRGRKPKLTRNTQSTPPPQRKKSVKEITTPVSTIINKTVTDDTPVNPDVSLDIINSEPDEKREEIICKYTVRSSKNRRSVSESDKAQVHNTYCVCKVYKGGALSIQCDKCLDYWHLECVSLKGLTKSMIDSIELWLCPKCFESPHVTKPETKILDSYVNQLKKQHVDQTEALRNELAKMTSMPLQHKDISSIHDDLLKAINFELKQITDEQKMSSKTEFHLAAQIADMKNSLDTLSNTRSSVSDSNTTPANRQTYVHKACKPFSQSRSDFLDDGLKSELQHLIDTNMTSFTKSGEGDCRSLLYYGEFGYKYSGHIHKPAEIPEVIQKIIGQLKETFPTSEKPNSCLISLYENGNQTCPPHSDDEPFIGPESDIMTISLGATRTMQFTDRRGANPSEDVELLDNSVLVFSRYSQNDWNHSILSDATVSEPRLSLTFRCLAPYNLNSTAVYGDSNTEQLRFGVGPGCCGKWMPGKRVKATGIKNLPSPDKIGTYRNLVLNVGINDLNDQNAKPMDSLISIYEGKCKDIMYVYPKMKIYISLILPTKNQYLNKLANEFNVLLENMASKYSSMSVIKHGCLVDKFGYLDQSLGRFNKNGFPSADIVHLGPGGYKRLVNNIKECIMFKGKKSIIPYSNKRQDKPLIRGPAPRSAQPQPDLQPTPPGFPNLHPSRSGFSPFPAHPQTLPTLPTPRSFDGNYRRAVSGRSNFVSSHPHINDGYQH